eukprot:m.5904 g.5904  ORF g.5904 m.5904 type:complete len:383 (+) comp14410_c0_seq1:31-1179(+)
MTAASLVALLVLIGSADALKTANPTTVEELILWTADGPGGVALYRIPIVASDGKDTLFAFAEARKDTSADQGPKFLAMRRGNVTRKEDWTVTNFIENDGVRFDGSNLGAVLTVRETGMIVLLYGICMHSCNASQTFVMMSKDRGETWEDPIDITYQIGDELQVFAGGPGYGIQKRHEPHQGRLIFCGWNCSVSADQSKTVGVKCIYSDDGGWKWKSGAWIPGLPYGQDKNQNDFFPDENQLVELSDGSILISIRNGLQYHSPSRIFARSFDAIETIPFETVTIVKDLISPSCAGSLLYIEEHDLLLHSNPYHPTERINMTLSWSFDQGTTWNHYQVWEGPSAYSCLVQIPGKKDQIGIMFETGEENRYDSIAMTIINLNVHY